jgi:hypothetical protein
MKKLGVCPRVRAFLVQRHHRVESHLDGRPANITARMTASELPQQHYSTRRFRRSRQVPSLWCPAGGTQVKRLVRAGGPVPWPIVVRVALISHHGQCTPGLRTSARRDRDARQRLSAREGLCGCRPSVGQTAVPDRDRARRSRAHAEAKKVRTRLTGQVDERATRVRARPSTNSWTATSTCWT